MKFVDDKIDYIEDDIQKVQMKTGMYISYLGKKGALHLSKEIINNAIDEAINKKSSCKKIIISYYTDTDTLVTEDDGRGIPENEFPLDIVCTKLNSGSKFTREQGGSTAGENGTGLTAVNALSSSFILSTFRNNKRHVLEFNEGVKIKDEFDNVNWKEHGTIVSFTPSKKYLGKSTEIPYKDLIKWVETISYFIPNKLKILFTVYNGNNILEEYKFKSKSILDLLKNKVDTFISDKYIFEDKINLVEDFQDRKINRELKLEFAFGYSNDSEPYIDSYCNFINTIDGGKHLDAVKEGITRYLSTSTKKSLTEREKGKLDITWADVLYGLNIVVNISTDMQMQFASQTKEKITNDALYDPIKNMTTDVLTKYFNDNNDKLNSIIKIIKLNAKARLEMNKVKNSVVKETTNTFSEHGMDNFTPANNRGKQYRELYIVEGKSAKGTAVAGRDPATQAFFAMRGVSANAFKKSLPEILENKEWKDLVKIMGCNIGSSFDINKLRYNKIIILTDADIDGAGITSLVAAFFVRYLPEIVNQGILYKAISPLYLIDNKNKPFVNNKAEYVEVFRNNITKNYKISLIENNDKYDLSKTEFNEFLYDTNMYSENLIRLSKHFGVNKYLIEKISAFICLENPDIINDSSLINELFYNDDNYNKIKLLLKNIQEKFPEITIKGDNSFRGIIDGHYQSLVVNERFVRKVKCLFEVYKKYGYLLYVKENKSDDVLMTIGEFLDATQNYVPTIKNRFKGLGESDPEELWETTLNPDTRTLIQLNFDNYDKDLSVFGILHGDSTKEKQARKDMMKGYKINRDDLDN